MTNLWSQNTPRNFWLCQPDPPQEAWTKAYQEAFPTLRLFDQIKNDIDLAVQLTLGEGQFGNNHWKLSPMKQLYYTFKPFLPRTFRNSLRQQYTKLNHADFRLQWPVENRYVHFQWKVVQQLMVALNQNSLSFRYFWPEAYQYAFVLTHDIETAQGQEYVRNIADLEESLGFRSSFNFVPELYEIDYPLLQELRERGFEIGVHGLCHDGKLFSSRRRFLERAERINHHLKEFGAVGFRSPLTMRNPEWLQALEVEYDLSFFDTDPFEPMPGGVMSIWPFTIGRFVELPYTLLQDSTLYNVLGECTPQLWLEKLDFIEQHHGMALLNTHPDYLSDPELREIYSSFLLSVKERGGYWHALPREVARWWRRREEQDIRSGNPESRLGKILLENEQVVVSSLLRSPSE